MFHSRWRIKCRPYCYNSRVPGKSAATASLVLGIIAVVLWFFGMTSILSVILGIIGLILAGNAKKAGFVGGIQTAGFVYYGGAIGFLLASFLYARCNQIPYSDIASPLVPALALFHIFGRIGYFLQGCCYGIPTQKGLAVIYQRSEIAPNDIPLFSVQLIEAGAEAAIFVLLLYHLKKRVRGSALTAIYLLSYGVLRFVLEFFRGDSYRGILYGLSLSQYISILGIVVGSVIVSASRRYTNSADYN